MAKLFSVLTTFRPRRVIRSEDHNALQTGLEASFDLLGTAPPTGKTGVSSAFWVGSATESGHAPTKAQVESWLNDAETGAATSATAAAASATAAASSASAAAATATAVDQVTTDLAADLVITQGLIADAIEPQRVYAIANYASFPVTGAVDTIYIDKATGDVYYWNGTSYVQTATGISAVSEDTSPSLGGNLDLNSKAFTMTLTASATVAAGDVCYINGSGEAALVDADAEATCSGQLVMAAGSITATNSGTFIVFGSLGGFSSMTPGTEYFASTTGTTGNTATTTKPSGTGDVVRKLYTALTSTTIFFNPSADYETVP